MNYEMKQRYLLAILSLVLLLSGGLYVLVGSGRDLARAAPPPRPLSDAPWGANVRVNDDAGTAYQWLPSIAVDAGGNAYAAWHDYRNGNMDIYFSYRPASGNWGPNVRVNDDAGTAYQYYPSIAVDASGNAYAVWNDWRNGNMDIYFSYRPVGGTWGVNVRVNDDAGTAWQDRPSIAVDPGGNAYAVWEDYRNGNGDIYFSYRPLGGNWGPNVRVNDDAGTAYQWLPSIAVDADGSAYAVWNDYRNDYYGGDIYFSYRPLGSNWGANVRVKDDAGTAGQDRPSIAVDPGGNAYAVWEDYRNGSDIYFSYRPLGGKWGANVRVNDDAGAAYQWEPSIALDATGNAYAVWVDYRNSNDDIYFSYRPVGGTWGANVRVNDHAGASWQWRPSIAVDPGGNAYAVWEDYRNGNGDIYFSYRPAGGGGDTDEDGLLDTWEQNGIDINGDGTVDLDLPAMGADPMHKDIFIEVDYMEHHRPHASAIQDVIDAFVRAPVSNPDGVDGINLHVIVDEEIPHQDVINVWADFDTIKGAHFATSAERSSPNWDNIRSAKGSVFRYALFVHQYNPYPSSSGIAELPGNDFIVSLGAPGWGTDASGHNVGTRDEQAGTFIHELGHTLGLHHGGGDDINCKPNYLSVMSYSRQFRDIVLGRPLDYSRQELPLLMESDLDEWLGVQGSASDLTVYGPPRDVDSDGDLDYPIASAFGAIDWDADGFMEGESVAGSNVHVNINYLGFWGCNDPADTQTLTGYDDWANLLYNFRASANYADGAHVTVADEEITVEVVEEIRETADFHKVYLPLILRNY